MPDFKFNTLPLSYTSRSYEEIRDELVSLIPFVAGNDWTDNSENDLGIVLVQLFAGIADVLHYYIDRQASECFLPTAITENSVKNINRLIGYTPSGPAPATVKLTFTLPGFITAANSYVIPALTQVSSSSLDTAEQITFETDDDLVIPIGISSGIVTATQGETKALPAPNGEILGLSTGLSFQTFRLLFDRVIDSSIRIFINEGASSSYVEWTKVDSFVLEEASSRVFKISKDSSGFTNIIFGDNINGKVPQVATTIQASYRIGGGKDGNIGAGTIKKILSSLNGGAAITVINQESAQGGTDAPTITEMKELGVKSLKTFGRAVTLDDYQSIALLNQGVAAAHAEFSSEEQTVNLYLAAGSGDVTSLVKDQVFAAIDEVDLLGYDLAIKDATLVPLDIIGTIHVKDSESRLKVVDRVNQALEDLFTISLADGHVYFGRDIFESDIFALLDNIEGVEYVEIVKLSRQPTINLINFTAKSSTIIVSVAPTNDIEQDIIITLPTAFNLGDNLLCTVQGTVTGLESTLLTAVFAGSGSPTTFQMGNADVAISIFLPSTTNIANGLALPPVEGDIVVISVGKYKGSQSAKILEIFEKGSISLSVQGGTI